MSLLRLEATADEDNLADITCPKCNKKFNINWNTEYGDALIGEHNVNCGNIRCDKVIYICVSINYSVR